MSMREEKRWDLAVVGGDGPGNDLAHEAAARGARVVLVMPGVGNGDPVGNEQVRVLTGMPRLVGAGELEIVSASESYAVSAETVVIGTGSRPWVPSSFSVDHDRVLDADSFERAAGTNRVAVVGAGRDGLRAATLLATTGVEVTLFDRRHRLLEECDSEMVDLVVEDIGRSGIRMRLGEDVLEVGPSVDGAMVVPIRGEVERFDRVVVSVGRVGNTDALGLERVGLETDERGRLWCDERFNTWVEGVCAVGSVIGHPNWLRNSLDQGKRLAVDVLFSGNFERGPAAAVTSSGTRPEILQAGRTTEELMAEGVDYESGRAGFVAGAVNSLKLLWTRRSGRVLGAHAIGPDVAASIGRVAAGMRRRLTVDRLLSSCGDDLLLREAATATGPLTTSGALPTAAVAPPVPIEGPAWRIDAV
tara:strand:+ start:289 stop:1539 length:1251 start_codon:yes stop_codon:yes gene_type:complete